MPPKPTDAPGEHRRKRVRKGTKSCWECRRKKIKCKFGPHNQSICDSCQTRNTVCVSQEFCEDRAPQDENLSALGLRLKRVETMLQTLVSNASDPAGNATNSPQTENTQSVHPNLDAAPQPGQEIHASADSFSWMVGKSHLLAKSHDDFYGMNQEGSSYFGHTSAKRPLEMLSRRLAGMLPSQECVNWLHDTTRGWWLIRQHMLPHLPRVSDNNYDDVFGVAKVSKKHPVIICRLLLCVSNSIQQLLHEQSVSHETGTSFKQMMEKNVSAVSRLVNSEDDLAASADAIECVLLLGLYHTSVGNLRRAWLYFRRAMAMCHLLGLHKISATTFSSTDVKRYCTWLQVLRGERYLSLTLGLPSAAGATTIPIDDKVEWLSAETLCHNRLCDVAGLILARNPDNLFNFLPVTYDIDIKLENMARSMPDTWWQMPPIPLADRTEEASCQYKNLMCQIWYYNLKITLHFPSMLRAATDRLCENSRAICMSACRALIQRWLCLRETGFHTIFSSLLKFQALSAAIRLLLGHLSSQSAARSPAATSPDYAQDYRLASTVFEVLGRLEESDGDQLVTQSISALRVLFCALDREPSFPENIRLEIPHFGIVGISRKGTIELVEDRQIPHTQGNARGVSPRNAHTMTPLSTTFTTSIGPTRPTPQETKMQTINPDYDTNGHASLTENITFPFQSNQYQDTSGLMMDANMPDSSLRAEEVLLLDSLLASDIDWKWSADLDAP